MNGIIACALDMPLLAEAIAARGLHLVHVGPGGMREALAGTSAALLGCGADEAAHRVGEVRGLGWHGPLMLVLAEGASEGIAPALDAGADDAVALPASAREIAARLAARLRQHAPPHELRLGELCIDRVERRVTRADREVPLLPREYALLLHLAQHPGRSLSRIALLRAVWGLRFDPGTNVVEVHVSRLRAKLDRGFAVPMLHTDKGEGYRLESAGS